MKTKIFGMLLMACLLVITGCNKNGTNGPECSSSPLCFTARNGSVDVRFDIVNATHTIQYSTDGKQWIIYTSGTTVTISADQSVYFRAESNQTTATAFAYWDSDKRTILTSQFEFSSTNGGIVEGSGNIMSLYGPDCPNLPLQEYAFSSLFEGCTLLTSAPSLPATTLAKACYGGLFYGCTALATAPSLPATTLVEGCYGSMFSHCAALTTAPSLPATTLAYQCYAGMFAECSALTTAPSLPATTLAEDCYMFMFRECSSLTAAPSLPATTLADYCYFSMFEWCESLTTAPTLPATTLKNGCYCEMLKGCTSLTAAPSLSATTLADSCYVHMFWKCTSLEVNIAGPGTQWQIPSNATPAKYWNQGMLSETGGDFTGDPEIGVTYYIASGAR